MRFGNKHLGAVFIFPRDRLERMKPAEVKDYLSYDLYKNFKDTRSLGKIFRYPLIEDHLARYEWAKEQVLGDVLDVGCGSGFGSELLAEGSKVSSVTGLDIHLYDLHESTKVSFVEADIISSELPTRTFNSVVAFEFVEHFDAQNIKIVLAKIRSVCDNQSVVFISTPNREAFSPIGKTWLPYHPIEYSLEELKALVSDNGFTVEEVYVQRPLIKLLHKIAAQIILFPTRVIKHHSIENRWIKILFAIFTRAELFLGKGVFCKFAKSENLYAKYLILKLRKNER